MTETQLYRHYDENGDLLYVGISLSAIGRLMQHRQEASWASQIRTVTIEVCPTREEAIKREMMAIAVEAPRHNRRRTAPILVPIGSAACPIPKELRDQADTAGLKVVCSEGNVTVKPKSGGPVGEKLNAIADIAIAAHKWAAEQPNVHASWPSHLYSDCPVFPAVFAGLRR